MRRSDREVTSPGKIREILDACKTCHLAMVDGGLPYVLPLSYGYAMDGGTLTLYFHSAHEGRKIDILRKNAAVCFEMCREGEPIFAEKSPCRSGYFYSSVHGFGTATFVLDAQEKCRALSLIMQQQAGMDVCFTAQQAEGVCVFKVVSADFTGKMKARPGL